MTTIDKQKHIRFDWAVKKLLRDKANFGILEGFLSELLKEDIKIQEIIESEGNKETVSDKTNRVDIMVKNSKQELIIIEIQNTRELDYFYKILYNTSKAISERMFEGMPFKEVVKVITVTLVYFDLGQGKDYIYYGNTQFKGMHHQDTLELSEPQKKMFDRSTVSSIYPDHYIIRVNEFDDNAKDKLDQWIYFFKNSEIKDEFNARGIDDARKKLKKIFLEGPELADYNRYIRQLSDEASIALTIKFEKEYALEKGHEEGFTKGLEKGFSKGREEGHIKGHEEGLNEGLKEGIKEGIKEGQKIKSMEIARNLKSKGIDTDFICDTTGLSREEILSL